MKTYRNYINGKPVASQGDEALEVINPSTGAVVSRVPESTDADLDAALDAAHAAQPAWAKRPAIERANLLRQVSAKLRENVGPLARTIVEEQGKTVGLAEVEVNFTADYIDYMAEWARRIEGEIIPSDRPGESIFLFREPFGVVGGILPWNFPFFLVARKMAPALVCGNAIVLKPSEETPNNAFEFARLIAGTDLPPGLVNIVSGRGAGVGKALAGSNRIGLISFTGSVNTGSAIMAAAAKNITRVNLELGGKAPAIVLDDADLDLAVAAVKNSRIINSGQVCNCAERVYVHEKVAAEFTEKLAKAMAAARCGDPLADTGVDYGPMINKAGFDKVDGLVRRAVGEGAQVVTGGGRADVAAGGHYFQPTVLAGCRHDMEIIRHETFGPVAPVVAVSGLEEAVALANDSEYGLTSSVYTRNLNAAMHACRALRFGETYVNRENFEAIQGYHAGWRKSGIGGADGKHGLHEFLQTHVVYLQA